MLRTNLATRPFYNDRAVRIGIALVALVAAGLTAFNASQILSLNERNSQFVGRAEGAEGRATDVRGRARSTRQTLDKEEVTVVQAASREANLLIERRAFSWTDLFNRFEETLPRDVRITAVTPQVDEDGRMLVAITAIAREFEDLTTFMDRLEGTGAFSAMVQRQTVAEDDGTQQAAIQGYYNPSGTPAAVEAPGASDSDKAPTNQSGNAAAPAPAGRGTPR